MKASERRRRRFPSFLLLALTAVALVWLAPWVTEPVAPGRSTASASSSLCSGDVNLDGLRDVRDLVLIQAHILGTNTLGPQALANADVN